MLKLRPAISTDASHLEKWDREPHVIKCVTDNPHAYTAFTNVDWQLEIDSDDPASNYYIAEVDGRPIGAMQVIDPALEITHYWGKDCPPNLCAMDIWIGEPDCIRKGYGTEMMGIAIDRAFETPQLEAIIIDPLASNTSAHLFYKRLGFRVIERRKFGEDDCLVHRLDRADWRKGA